MKIAEPTAEQCSNEEKVFEDEHKIGCAIWYPQMGGYSRKAVALFDKKWILYHSGSAEGGCVDVLVWHDGSLPFSRDDPKEIHICDPKQFIEFGRVLNEINEHGCVKVLR